MHMLFYDDLVAMFAQLVIQHGPNLSSRGSGLDAASNRTMGRHFSIFTAARCVNRVRRFSHCFAEQITTPILETFFCEDKDPSASMRFCMDTH